MMLLGLLLAWQSKASPRDLQEGFRCGGGGLWVREEEAYAKDAEFARRTLRKSENTDEEGYGWKR